MYLIDANIFLELQLEQRRADECELLLEAVRIGRREGFLTDLVLDTILIIMEEKGKAPADLEHFLASLASYKGLRLYFLTLRDRLEATRAMTQFDLDFENSTLVQAATRLEAEGIVSFDKDFDHVEGVRRFEPSDLVGRFRR